MIYHASEPVKILNVDLDRGEATFYYVSEEHKPGNVRTAPILRFRTDGGVKEMIDDAIYNQSNNARF